MCGIVAIHSSGPPVPAAAIGAGLRALTHRGPDGVATWLSPQGDLALGHARLSVIDLAGGTQPLVSEDGRVVAVVTGEFYGFQEIRRDLEGRGHRFRTRSDSEILLHLYEDAGVDCLDELRGEFAFVLWDADRGRLFAGRDRFGIKPLFYARTGDGIALASEAKALFAAGVRAVWDEESMYRQLLACPAEDRTLFAGVRQVPAGNYLVEGNGQILVKRYWDPDYPVEPGPLASGFADRLGGTIAEAVSARLLADVPVGVMVSGGLDSSIVLGLAARAAGTVTAFTVSFEHPLYDETPAARVAAAAAGAILYETRVGYGDIAAHFADTVWHGEGLCFNGHAVARYLLARDVRRAGVKAVLAGEGADELFAGYSFSACDAAHPSPACPDLPDAPWVRDVTRRLGRVPALISGLATTRAPVRRLISPEYSEHFGGPDPLASMLDGVDLTRLARYHPVFRSLYIWSRALLPGYVLAAERLDMAHGLEVRQPFLDHHLFALTRTAPAALLVRDEGDKHLLRAVAMSRGWVPESIARAPKHPFTAPPATLTLSNPLLVWAQDTLRGRALGSVPVIDRGAVVALLDALPGMSASSRIAHDPILMMLCSLCVLQERYIANGRPE